VRLRELGRIRLKDLERRELLFQLDIDGLPTSFARRKAAREGRRWWLPALAVAAVAALALGSTALISRHDGSPSGLTRVDVNAMGVIDAGRNALVGQVKVGIRPTRIAVEPHGIWVVNEGDGTVSRVNAQTLAVTRTISTPGSTLDVAASAVAVWVVGHQRRGNVGKGTALVYRIAPANAFVTNTTVIPSIALQGITVSNVAAVERSVWVSGGLDVVRLNPATGAIAGHVWDGGASDLAADQSSLWITRGGADVVDAGEATRIDRATGSVTVTVPVGNGETHVTLGFGAAWIGVEGSVRRLDAMSGVAMATIPIEGIVSDITVGAGAVWAADSSSGTVVRIDPKTNAVVETIRLGNRPDGIAFLDGKVYVTVY
jgi:YVTN family beta-propeller protein